MDWGTIFDDTLREALGMSAILYAMAAIGLNIQFGYTGLLNFGQVGFMAAGAYGLAISVTQFDLPLWAGWLCGIGAAMVLALLLGLPTLRLRADYLAIVTIAAGEIIRNVMRVSEYRGVTGGANGLPDFAGGFRDTNPLPTTPPSWLQPPSWLPSWAPWPAQSDAYGFGPWQYNGDRFWFRLFGWGLVLLAVLVVYLLMRSPWGRVVKAVRDDEDAPRSLGKNAYAYKMQSLMVGGVIAAVGAMFFVSSNNSVTPGGYRPQVTFFAYVALILGGAAKTWGPVLGSMLLWSLLTFIDRVLVQGVEAGHISTNLMDINQVGDVRNIMLGLILALLVIFRPQGIFGDRREVALEAR